MKIRKCTFITTKARFHSPPLARILVLVFLASLSAPIAPIVSVNVEVDVRAVGEQNFLSTATSLLANQPTERELHTPLDVSKGKGLTADDYLWQNVITEIQGREYAVVYDEPDNLVRLDRSEISRGLFSIHPLEITGASADSFFADLAFVDLLNAENSANNESLRVFWFSKLVRGAAEIHIAPRGNAGRRVTALCSALTDLEARRKVLHLYAGAARGGGIDVCAGEEDGRDRCVSREEWNTSRGWRGWQVLRHPSGFSHLELAIDEPLAGDMLPACSAGNMLHRLVVSLNAFQAVPPNVTLDITIDGTVLLTAPLTPVISGHGEEAGAEGEGKRGRDSVREGEWDQVWCDLALGGKWEKRLEHMSGRCSFLLMLRPLQVGRHTAQAMLKSSVTLRNISVVTPFTVVGGVLEEQQGVQVVAKRLERTPVQEAKGLWVWKSIQVPELGEAAAQVEAHFKRHKRQLLRDLLAENQLLEQQLPPSRHHPASSHAETEAEEGGAGGGAEGRGAPRGGGGAQEEFSQEEVATKRRTREAQTETIPIAEQMYRAEAAAHAQIVFPLADTTLQVVDKVLTSLLY